MSIEERSRQYGTVFDCWQVGAFLGSGAGGKSAVFQLDHCASDRICTLKVVNIIEQPGRLDRLTEEQFRAYDMNRRELFRNAERELRSLEAFRGEAGLVEYREYEVLDWSDATGYGRDLLIRMDMMTDLRSEMREGRRFNEEEVIRIGRDICAALILCHRRNILHRDVKPENIFRNRDGSYKLGDLGISRILDLCHPDAVTGAGVFEYWSPQQMSGYCDKRADIYSLGLVLYELCNGNRLPFAESSQVTDGEVSLRLGGQPLPPPRNAGDGLARVILTACAYLPQDRYQDAEEMLQALEWAAGNTGKVPAGCDARPGAPARKKSGSYELLRKLLAVLLSLSAVCTAFVLVDLWKELKKDPEPAGPPLMQQAPETEPAVTVPPQTQMPPQTEAAEIPAETEAAVMPEETLPETEAVLDPTRIMGMAVGAYHVAAWYEDGSVELAPRRDASVGWDASAVEGWTEITALALADSHLVGLRRDGTVVAAGARDRGECAVSEWTGIQAVATANGVTVGLRQDGTLVAAGDVKRLGDVGGLSGVTAIHLGSGQLEFLLSDGTWGRLERDGSQTVYGEWPELRSIYSNAEDSIGVLADGTLVIPRTVRLDRKALSGWTGITQVWGDSACLLGLKEDGTVLATGTENSDFRQHVAHWRNVRMLAGISLGVTEEGTVCVSGSLPQKFDLGPLNRADRVNGGVPHRVISDIGVNVRQGPGTDYFKATWLPAGTVVTVLEQKPAADGKLWGRTMYGWLCMDYAELVEN